MERKSMTRELVEWVNRLPDSVKAVISAKTVQDLQDAVDRAREAVVRRGYEITGAKHRLQAKKISSGGLFEHATYDVDTNKFHIYASLTSLEEIEDLVELLRAWRDV